MDNNSSPKIKRKHIDLHKNSPKDIKQQKSVFHQFRKVKHIERKGRLDHGEDTTSSDNSLDTPSERRVSRKPSLVSRRVSPPTHPRSRDDLSSLHTPVTQRPPQPGRTVQAKPSCGIYLERNKIVLVLIICDNKTSQAPLHTDLQLWSQDPQLRSSPWQVG